MRKSDHLTPTQRNQIRYHIRATESGIARRFGISVAVVRDVRRRAQPDHPARVAAKERRIGVIDASKITTGTFPTGIVTKAEVPAPELPPVLHTEGGVDLPTPLG